jgi:hypothetical protein
MSLLMTAITAIANLYASSKAETVSNASAARAAKLAQRNRGGVSVAARGQKGIAKANTIKADLMGALAELRGTISDMEQGLAEAHAELPALEAALERRKATAAADLAVWQEAQRHAGEHPTKASEARKAEGAVGRADGLVEAAEEDLRIGRRVVERLAAAIEEAQAVLSEFPAAYREGVVPAPSRAAQTTGQPLDVPTFVGADEEDEIEEVKAS